jgi:hypothetical protein
MNDHGEASEDWQRADRKGVERDGSEDIRDGQQCGMP